MIGYFLNWMGPVSNRWYEDHNLRKRIADRYSERLGQYIPTYEIKKSTPPEGLMSVDFLWMSTMTVSANIQCH